MIRGTGTRLRRCPVRNPARSTGISAQELRHRPQHGRSSSALYKGVTVNFRRAIRIRINRAGRNRKSHNRSFDASLDATKRATGRSRSRRRSRIRMQNRTLSNPLRTGLCENNRERTLWHTGDVDFSELNALSIRAGSGTPASSPASCRVMSSIRKQPGSRASARTCSQFSSGYFCRNSATSQIHFKLVQP